MKDLKKIVILCGGQSGESEVSLKSAAPVLKVLETIYPVQCIKLEVNKLPEGLNPNTDLIFPLIHGDFGEDGQLQSLLDEGNFAYIGSGVNASKICIDKMISKTLAKNNDLPVLPGIRLNSGDPLNSFNIEGTIGQKPLVLKPTDKGSSIGVHICKNIDELKTVWTSINEGHWMIEPYVHGRELTVGILQGKALGAVEIRPKQGFYDFKNKYTAGSCEYLYPAPIGEATLQQLQNIAEVFFEKAGCLDFGRVDFLLEPDGHVWFLEMNTIPGMTDQSLFPKSASCVGIAFEEILKKLIKGAYQRFNKK